MTATVLFFRKQTDTVDSLGVSAALVADSTKATSFAALSEPLFPSVDFACRHGTHTSEVSQLRSKQTTPPHFFAALSESLSLLFDFACRHGTSNMSEVALKLAKEIKTKLGG